MKLLSYEHFKMLNESSQQFEKELDQILNEDIASIITSPVKFVKIKNNAKKYQKALVQQQLNDIDLAKKKAASKEAGKPTDVLNAANKAKNASLRDLATGISDRMDDLATTDILKNISSLAKTKAKVAAAETALKAADETESKELKIKIKKLNAKAAEATKAIKDYESSEKKKDDTPADTEVTKTEPKKAETAAEPKKAETKTSEKPKNDADELLRIKSELQEDEARLSGAKAKLQDLKSKVSDAKQKLDSASPTTKAKYQEEYNKLSNESSKLADTIADMEEGIKITREEYAKASSKIQSKK
jgi:hypothetical protein